MSPRSLLAWFWTFVILFLCWLPSWLLGVKEHGPRPFLLENVDKLVHFGLFAIFAFLWMRVDRATGWVLRVLLASLALAFISEMGQELPIVSRDASKMDGVADLVGAGVGISAYLLLRRFLEKKVPAPDV